MFYVGIDAGSRACKLAVVEEGKLVATSLADQGMDQEKIASELLEQVLAENGMEKSQIAFILATGYGRDSLTFADAAVTEITCHAKGVRFFRPDVRGIVEIGGQDSKVIKLFDNGSVEDFRMNDKCAAGTGRFLEMVASRLDCGMFELGELARKSTAPTVISSMCAVFAESEIIGLLAKGVAREDLAAGALNSVAGRMKALAGRSLTGPVVFTGGVSLLPGMREALSESLSCEVEEIEQAQFTGAVGAALLASMRSRE